MLDLLDDSPRLNLIYMDIDYRCNLIEARSVVEMVPTSCAQSLTADAKVFASAICEHDFYHGLSPFINDNLLTKFLMFLEKLGGRLVLPVVPLGYLTVSIVNLKQTNVNIDCV